MECEYEFKEKRNDVKKFGHVFLKQMLKGISLFW